MQTEITANSRCVDYGNITAENDIYSGLDSYSLSAINEIWVSKKARGSCILTTGQVFASQMLFEQMAKIGWKVRAIEPIKKGVLNIYFNKEVA